MNGNATELGGGLLEGEGGTVALLTSTSGDLDGDGSPDQAAILVHDSRGSGVFYYLNVFLSDDSGGLRLAGEEFLGDRIKLDFMELYRAGSISTVTGVSRHPDDYGQLYAAYFTHGRDQAYSEDPGVFVTRHWKIDDGKLVAVEDYKKVRKRPIWRFGKTLSPKKMSCQ